MGRPRSSSTGCGMTTRTSSRRCSGPCSALPRSVGVIDMEDQEPRDADEGDEIEAEIMQADHAFGAESVGTTVEEELAGETLDQHLAEERPERPGIDTALSVVDEGTSDEDRKSTRLNS